MDMSKIDAVNIKSEEAAGNKPKQQKSTVKRHHHVENHRAPRHIVRHQSSVKQSNKYQEHFPGKYSNIRVSLDIANWLKAMQKVTGDRSRTQLLKRFRPIVDQVILNSPKLEKKCHKDLKLIEKKEKLVAELNNKM